MDGIVQVVLCSAGIEAGIGRMLEPVASEGDQLLEELREIHDELRGKVLSIYDYSVDDLATTMRTFLEQCLEILSYLRIG